MAAAISDPGVFDHYSPRLCYRAPAHRLVSAIATAGPYTNGVFVGIVFKAGERRLLGLGHPNRGPYGRTAATPPSCRPSQSNFPTGLG